MLASGLLATCILRLTILRLMGLLWAVHHADRLAPELCLVAHLVRLGCIAAEWVLSPGVVLARINLSRPMGRLCVVSRRWLGYQLTGPSATRQCHSNSLAWGSWGYWLRGSIYGSAILHKIFFIFIYFLFIYLLFYLFIILTVAADHPRGWKFLTKFHDAGTGGGL